MFTQDDVRETVEQLVAAMAGERSDRPEMPAGASEAQIDALAARFGGQVPPSFGMFLRIHDGWPKFTGDAQILSSQEFDADWVTTRIAWFRSLLEQDGEEEVLDDTVVFMMGRYEPDFALFDLRERNEHGELEVMHWDLREGELDRYDSFLDFLDDTIDVIQS